MTKIGTYNHAQPKDEMQPIIDKLQLKLLNQVIGQSFRHEIKVYLWKPGILVAQCDAYGHPIGLNQVSVFNMFTKKTIRITFEMIMHCDNDFLEKNIIRKTEYEKRITW